MGYKRIRRGLESGILSRSAALRSRPARLAWPLSASAGGSTKLLRVLPFETAKFRTFANCDVSRISAIKDLTCIVSTSFRVCIVLTSIIVYSIFSISIDFLVIVQIALQSRIQSIRTNMLILFLFSSSRGELQNASSTESSSSRSRSEVDFRL